MDGNQFDDITRRLAADASRRSFLKRTAAAIVALAGAGGVSHADAARRPTPTPKPVSCPGSQTWDGFACVCANGTAQCGPACCPAGATCCDNACCYGTCYGEELCCPTGQLVCNGVCLSPGQCCTNENCGPGLICVGNICICQPTTSCASAGLNCGTFTDDCGAIHDCGACTAPQSCGGGGVTGVCGCTSTMTCEGRCGSVTTECGTVLDCGNPCGPCQSCTQNICQNVENGIACNDSECVVDAICVSGVCSGGRPKICEEDVADRCNRSECDPALGCIKIPTNEGNACNDNPCQPGACVNGACTEKEMECPPCQSCQGDTCAPSDDGSACGNGFHCLGGFCCNLPTIDGVAPTSPDVLMSCFATDSICCDESAGPCCPGTGDCCDICVTYNENGVERNKCCEPENICGESCCWFTHMCVAGRCAERNSVCEGNVICNDVCCGGSGSGEGACCGPNSYCVNGECKPKATGECTSHAECVTLYGSGAVCAGLDFIPGPEPWEVRTPGVCCPNGFSIMGQFGGTGPIYNCCATNERPLAGGGCCAYPFHACSGAGTCSCSRTTVRRWGR